MDVTPWNQAWATNAKSPYKPIPHANLHKKSTKKSPKLFITRPLKKPVKPPQTKFIPVPYFTKSPHHEALILKLDQDLLRIWNSPISANNSSRALIRWKNKQNTLRNKEDHTQNLLHLWYGPYGWGITGKLAKQW